MMNLFKISIGVLFILKGLFADPSFSPIPIDKIENKEKYDLGKKLFFDSNLSKDKTIACVTCHVLELGGADGNQISLGVNGAKGVINSPTIFNVKFNIAQDWIGEYSSIKKRSKMAFLSKIEMAGDVVETIKYIKSKKNLNDRFLKIYDKLDEDAIFDAIAYFVSSLTTPNSKFDKFLKGDEKALSKQEKEGYKLFVEYGCVSCHNGVNIGGNMYHKFGIFNEKRLRRDKNQGRYKITKRIYDKYVFKVPSLRNVSKTAPYLHNGLLNELKTVIKKMGEYQLGIDMPVDDILKIELFLKTLEGNKSSEQ